VDERIDWGENKHCRYFNKTVEPQLPACSYFVNWYVGHLL